MLRAFFNGRAAIWDETVAEKDVTKLAQMAKRLELEPGATVLDVGTGTGVFLPYILKMIGGDGKIVAIGFSDADFALARYNADGSLDSTFGTNGWFKNSRSCCCNCCYKSC